MSRCALSLSSFLGLTAASEPGLELVSGTVRSFKSLEIKAAGEGRLKCLKMRFVVCITYPHPFLPLLFSSTMLIYQQSHSFSYFSFFFPLV